MFKLQLLDNEKVVKIYRQTEATLFKPVLTIFVLIYFPWFFIIKYELVDNYSRLLLFWTFLVFLYGLNRYLLWLLNVYIVTNQRIISAKYSSLFSKRILESPYNRILNVSFSSSGIWQSLCDYGTVEVQVAGLTEPLELKNVAHPAKLKDFLWKVQQKYGSSAGLHHKINEDVVIHKPRVA